MGLRSTLKNSAKRGFNLHRWVGGEHLRDNATIIKQMAKALFSSQPTSADTLKLNFDQAMRKYGVTESTLVKKKQFCLYMAIAYSVVMVLLVGYGLYLFWHASILGGAMSWMLAAIAGALGFREHFNYMQITLRRLGCTVKDWLQFIVQHWRGRP